MKKKISDTENHLIISIDVEISCGEPLKGVSKHYTGNVTPIGAVCVMAANATKLTFLWGSCL